MGLPYIFPSHSILCQSLLRSDMKGKEASELVLSTNGKQLTIRSLVFNSADDRYLYLLGDDLSVCRFVIIIYKIPATINTDT